MKQGSLDTLSVGRFFCPVGATYARCGDIGVRQELLRVATEEQIRRDCGMILPFVLSHQSPAD